MPLAPRPSRRPSAAGGRSAPSRVPLAAVVVLLLLFAASFMVGRLAGPLSPGDFPGSGGHGGGTMPGMPGMNMNGMGAAAPQPVNSTAGDWR